MVIIARTFRARQTIAAVLAVFLLLSQPNLAGASDASACAEYSYVNRHIGYVTDQWPDHRWGNRAFLDLQTLAQCTLPRTGEGNGSFALVNLVGPPDDPLLDDIVQVGFGQCRGPGTACTGTMRDTWSFGVDPFTPGCEGWQEIVPSVHVLPTFSGGQTFSVSHHDGNFHLTTSGGTVHVHVNDSQVCWKVNFADTFNESWDVGDALGGRTTNTFTFSAMQFQTVANGPWLNLPASCNLRSGPNGGQLEGIFKCWVPSAGSIADWTDR
jgi:hypothetical protein